MYDNLDKIPPQAVDLEEAVLGAVIMESAAMDVVGDQLRPEHFYKPAHSDIWNAITSLYNKSEPIDILTVRKRLEKMAKLDDAGGAYYLAQLTSKVNSSANLEYHTKLIIEYAMKRQVLEMANEATHGVYDETSDVFDIIGHADTKLSQIALNTVKKEAVKFYDSYRASIEKMEELAKSDLSISGIPTGFTKLDQVLGGLQDSDMIVIAARPGMGKTALMLSIIRNIAVDGEYPAAIFSLEMSTKQLTDRVISSEAEISSENIRIGKLEDHEWKQLLYKTSKVAESPIYIDDTPAISITELRAKARRLVKKYGVRVIAIDYLQLMKSAIDNKRNHNREQEISNISSGIKALAKELNIPIIALSQLSRAVESRSDKKPLLSDLRESGSIEQDSDVVVFLWRPEYYDIPEDENGDSTAGVAMINVAKHRNGRTGETKLTWIPKFTKFTDPIYENHITYRQIPVESSDPF